MNDDDWAISVLKKMSKFDRLGFGEDAKITLFLSSIVSALMTRDNLDPLVQ